MSGWTNVTLEPKDETVERKPMLSPIKNIKTDVERIHDKYDETDTEDVIETLERIRDLSDEIIHKNGSFDAYEIVDEFISNKTHGSARDMRNYREHTYQTSLRGLARDKQDAKEYAQELIDNCEHIRRVLIVSANDTGNDGAGILFKNEDGVATLVEQWHGYQGARGEDVTGYFKEQHNISGTASEGV